MNQTNYDSEKAMPTLIPSELIETARKQIESLLEVQKELVQTLEGINHDVFRRAKKEADIASEFVGKLASARSITDATTTYQEWATKEMEPTGDDELVVRRYPSGADKEAVAGLRDLLHAGMPQLLVADQDAEPARVLPRTGGRDYKFQLSSTSTVTCDKTAKRRSSRR